MRTFVRSIGALLAAGVLVAACGASATPSPVPTVSSAPTASPAPSPAATPAPSRQPAPTATPVQSVEPMSPAYVTGTAHIDTLVSQGMTTQDGVVSRVTGIRFETSGTMSDPRVSGKGTNELQGAGIGGTGFEWGTVRIENAGGAWTGTCSGGIWANTNASDLSCWLTGSGVYQGLTFYEHLSTAGYDAEIIGVIVPVAPPKS